MPRQLRLVQQPYDDRPGLRRRLRLTGKVHQRHSNDERRATLRAAMQARCTSSTSATPSAKAKTTNQFASSSSTRSTGERTVLWDRDQRLALQAQGFRRALRRPAASRRRRGRGAGDRRRAGAATGRHARHHDSIASPIAHPGPCGVRSRFRRARAGGADRPRRPRGGAARAAARHGGCSASRSAHGALALDGRRPIQVAGLHRSRPMEATGAGDVFRAGFITGLLAGSPRPERYDSPTPPRR